MKEQLLKSIEAILFATSEPQTFTSLSTRLNVSKEEVTEATLELATMFEGHGITLLMQNDTAMLATKPSESALIETIRKEELSRELTKAQAETLAIILYTPDATRAQIEFIRGVNATYSIRALMIRGLVEQKGSGRTVTYVPTIDTLKFFGVSTIGELVNFEINQKTITELLNRGVNEPQQ